ncbi:MAG: family efflux transporter subunit, HlyD family secretion protein [Parcubacteria group bacterium]|nr:family efflux transporter subunit, HlyD family secretion protein [Parcubacteria group bacterium]
MSRFSMISRLLGRIGSFFGGLGGYAKRHKIQAVLLLLVLAGLSYWGYTAYAKSVTTTQYVLAVVRNAPIEETVTASGQIASEHQLNLSPKASGALTSVPVKAGQQVGVGQIVATIDSTDAQKSLRDAATNLESARISYQQSQTTNTNTVQKSSDAVFSSSATVYSDIGTVLAGINTIMQGSEVSGSYAVKNVYAYAKHYNDNPGLTSYRDRLIASYDAADSAYRAAVTAYNSVNRGSDPTTVAALAERTNRAAQSAAQAAKDLNDYLNAVHAFALNDPAAPSILTSHISTSLSYVTTMNADVNASLTAKNDLASAIQTSGSGSVSLSAEAAQLSYQKAQNSYQDAKDALANYVVRAPFAGTIASVPLQRFDQAGSGTTVAVLITKQQFATLSLNEVDVAKVKSGQKATLTFDSIDGLTLDGTVAEVDALGAVSSGVVSYTVKIGFDSKDTRILPGMTVNAAIVIASSEAALVVPSSAIKTQGTESYVEVASFTAGAPQTGGTGTSTQRFATSTPRTGAAGATRGGTGLTVDAATVTTRRVTVQTGIVSDTMTEVVSGLNPGEFVVSSSLNATGKTTTQAKSIFSLFGAAPGARTGTTGTGGAARTTTGGGNAGFAGRAGG